MARIDALFAVWNKPDAPGRYLAVIRNSLMEYGRGYGMLRMRPWRYVRWIYGKHWSRAQPALRVISLSVSAQRLEVRTKFGRS